MTTSHRHTAFCSAVFAVAAALVQGCGFNAASRELPPAGTLVDEPCQKELPGPARCARLSVFENRITRSGRRIPLRIVVLQASGRDRVPDPVFYLAGGPGQPATALARFEGIGGRALRGQRDLVFADQRGTGGSNGLTCVFYGPPENPQSYFDLFMPPEKIRACRERLERKADLTQYTTSHSVDDLDEVRAALGYERVNLVGGSYGTRLALEYVRRHESRVRSVVLDGAVPPSKHMPEQFGRMAQRSLDGLLEECERDRECGSAFPGIRGKARVVFERLAEAPARAHVAHPASGRRAEVVLTREHVAEAIRYMTYSSNDAARVPLYLHEAYKGDYSPIAEFLLRWRADGEFEALYLCITCAEDVPFVSPQAERDDEQTYLGGYRVREQRAGCAEWRRGAAPESLGRDVRSKVPALILSGALDPVTPPEDGAAVARSMPASLHVTIPFGGHSAAGLRGVGCVTALRSAFIDRGTVEGLDTACVSGISRPGFVTGR